MTITRRHMTSLLAASAFAGVARPLMAAKAPDGVVVGIPNNVYANLSDGRPTGIMVESIAMILQRMAKRPSFLVMPNSEMPRAMERGSVDVVSVAIKTPANEKNAFFTDPLVIEHNIIAVLNGHQFELNHISDLHNKTLGGREGFRYPILEKDPAIKLQRFDSDGALMRNLILGRIDAAVISALSDMYKFRSEGVMSKMTILNKSVGEVQLCAALSFSRFTPDDLARFNSELAGLKAGPEWQRLLEANGLADLVREWPSLE